MSEPLILQTFPSFAALRTAAPDLAAESMPGDFFYSLAWFETLANAGFAADATLALLFAGDRQGTWQLCLPLVDTVPLTGLSNFYSSLYGPIGAGGQIPLIVWSALACALHEHPRGWPILRLQPLDQDTPLFQHFPAALAQAGYWVDSYHCFGNWALDVAGRNFEAYFLTLPARLQNTVRRARRKLDKAGVWKISLHDQVDAQLETAITEFEAIYAASWKEPEAFPNFIPEFCRLAARRGWLRLGILHLDGRAIAAQIWLVKDGKASIFKLAYRQGLQPFSPGSVLTSELMRQAIDGDGVHEVDYLSGDDAYKRDWMSHRRERRGIVAFRPDTGKGLFAAARHFLGKKLRQLKAA